MEPLWVYKNIAQVKLANVYFNLFNKFEGIPFHDLFQFDNSIMFILLQVSTRTSHFIHQPSFGIPQLSGRQELC